MNPYSPPGPPPGYPAAPPDYGVAAPVTGGVTELAVDLLRQTRPWVMFLGILCFVASAFMLLGGIAMIGLGAMASEGAEGGMRAALGIVYLPLAGLYVYPGIKMWMYGTAIGRLMASRATADLEAALLQQKSLWKFSGIAAIVVVVLYLLFFVGAIAFGVAKGLGKM